MNNTLQKCISTTQNVVRFLFSTTALLVVSSFIIGIVAGKNISSGTDSILFLSGVFGLGLYQWIGVREHQVAVKTEKKDTLKAVQKLEKKIARHVRTQKSPV